MTKPAKSNWAAGFTRPESAPKDQLQAEDNAAQPAATPPAPVARPAVVKPARKAETFRLPLDVRALIRAEVNAAAEAGDRLTKDEAVIRAIRSAYGKKHDAATVQALSDALNTETR